MILYENRYVYFSFLFFFNDPSTTEIYTLSLHDALPICGSFGQGRGREFLRVVVSPVHGGEIQDRKSTRLNSSHVAISYAVFCLKKKKQQQSIRQEVQPNHPTCHRNALNHSHPQETAL